MENVETLKKNQEEERKKKVKLTVTSLFKQMKSGCGKAICFNQNCAKNPLSLPKLKFTNDKAILEEVVKIA